MEKDNQYCKDHPNEIKKYFCKNETCKTLICITCRSEKHNGHTYDNLEDALEFKRVHYSKLISCFNQNEKDRKDKEEISKDAVLKAIKELLDSRENYEKNIVKKFCEAKKAIEENTKELFKKIKDLCTKGFAFNNMYRQVFQPNELSKRHKEILTALEKNEISEMLKVYEMDNNFPLLKEKDNNDDFLKVINDEILKDIEHYKGVIEQSTKGFDEYFNYLTNSLKAHDYISVLNKIISEKGKEIEKKQADCEEKLAELNKKKLLLADKKKECKDVNDKITNLQAEIKSKEKIKDDLNEQLDHAKLENIKKIVDVYTKNRINKRCIDKIIEDINKKHEELLKKVDDSVNVISKSDVAQQIIKLNEMFIGLFSEKLSAIEKGATVKWSSLLDEKHNQYKLNTVLESGCWLCNNTDANPWIEFSFPKAVLWWGVKTQGSATKPEEHVTKYKIQFIAINEWNTLPDTFEGNKDGNTVVNLNFSHPVQSTAIRLCPIACNLNKSIRLDFIFSSLN